MTAATLLETLGKRASAQGLILRGAFHCGPDDAAPVLASGEPARTIVLLGQAGSRDWARFAASPESADGAPHPLDRWSARVIGALAVEVGATALFPFGGPPHHPFQRWAKRAEPVHRSPLGLLIHPEYGLWHSYRGALAFAQALDLPPVARAASPCETCVEKPCLSACPVGAFTRAGYDVGACAGHIGEPNGAPCLSGGCLARHACPVGAAYRQTPDHAAFHMAAFLAARG